MTTQEYYQRKRTELLMVFGGICQACGERHGLEFAHVQPTRCTGKGRGSWRRLADVLRRPGAYVLLCMSCHDSLDGRPRRKRQPEIRGHL
jgi:hypothetical protein